MKLELELIGSVAFNSAAAKKIAIDCNRVWFAIQVVAQLKSPLFLFVDVGGNLKKAECLHIVYCSDFLLHLNWNEVRFSFPFNNIYIFRGAFNRFVRIFLRPDKSII